MWEPFSFQLTGNLVKLDEFFSTRYPVALMGCGILCCIVSSSWILNRWPGLIYRPKLPFLGLKTTNMAHRGGQGERPENTMMAFKYAIDECKCDSLELDTQMTKDFKIVACHDADLDRVCGTKTEVKMTNYADLPETSSSTELGSNFFEFMPNFEGFENDFGPQKIPLLEDVFKEFPNIPIIVDVKGPDVKEAYDEITNLVNRYNRQKLTLFRNPDTVGMNELRKRCPDGQFSFTNRRLNLVCALYYMGLLPFFPIYEDVLEMPVCWWYFKEQAKEYAEEMKKGKPTWMHGFIDKWCLFSHYFNYTTKCNSGFISALQRRGLVAIGWVLNTKEEYHDAIFKLGLNGIITDRPKLLQKYLNCATDQ